MQLYAIHDAPGDEIWMLEKWSSVAELDAHGQARRWPGSAS